MAAELSTFNRGRDNHSLPEPNAYEIIDINALDPSEIKELFKHFKFTITRIPESLANRKICTLIARSLGNDEMLPEYIGMIEVRRCSELLGNLTANKKDPDALDYDNTCKIESLEVIPNWRRSKVGTQLVINAMKIASSMGQEYMKVIHPSWNEHYEIEMRSTLRMYHDGELVDPELEKIISVGKINKLFFDKLPGFLPRSCDNSYSQRENERRIVTYDLSRIDEVHSIPLSDCMNDRRDEQLSLTGITKIELAPQASREINKGYLFQIWEGENYRGMLLGTAHDVSEDCLEFRSAIREGIGQSSIVLCERMPNIPQRLDSVHRYQISNGTWIGIMDAELVSMALNNNKPVKGLEEEEFPLDDTFINPNIIPSSHRSLSLILETGNIWSKGALEDLAPQWKKNLKIQGIKANRLAEANDLLLTRRNMIQAQGILDELTKSKEAILFAMVGAGHLPDMKFGSDPDIKGLISILQANGYRLTQI